jgi:hypothetical protein
VLLLSSGGGGAASDGWTGWWRRLEALQPGALLQRGRALEAVALERGVAAFHEA